MKHEPEENNDDLETLKDTQNIGFWMEKDYSDHPGTSLKGDFTRTNRARIGWQCAYCDSVVSNPCAKAV